MKNLLLAILIGIMSFTNGIQEVDHSTLNNSIITTINGETVEGYEVSKEYKKYEKMIDLKTGEDSGIVVFYTKNLKDIKVIDNR